MTTVSWLSLSGPGRLGIMPRPRGGDWLDYEIKSLCESDVTTLVCLLTDSELDELDLAGLHHVCTAKNIEFVHHPIADRGVPVSTQGCEDLLRAIDQRVSAGSSVVVHCRFGIGRSALVCAGVLVLGGVDPASAFTHVSAARGMPVPDTDHQREWVENLAKRLAR